MAELTPKVITELPELTSIPDTAAFAVSSGGSSRRTLWSTIKSAFVRRAVTGGDAFLSADYANNQPIVLWQVNTDSTEQYGLVVSKTYIGLYDAINSTWVWRTPLMSQSLGAWQIEQGGTGATTAAAARSNLEVPSIHDLTSAQSYAINGVNFIFRRYGKIVVCTTDGAVTEEVSTNASMGNAQVADIFKPISAEIRYIQVTPAADIQFNLNTNGLFQVGYASSNIVSGVSLRGTFVYMAAG